MQKRSAPERVTVTPVGQADVVRSNNAKLRWGIFCIVAPTALLILTIIAYALLNYVTGDGTSLLRTMTNIVLFLIGVFVVLTWLPGLIVGTMLLSTRKNIR